MRELPKSVIKKYMFLTPDELLKMETGVIKQVIEVLQRDRILASGSDKREFELMLKSNMKLVDENRMLKNDIKLLVGYLQGTRLLEQEELSNILEYYGRKEINENVN